jgi:hypothetical protein
MGFGILFWDFSGQVIAAMATQIMARLDRFCTVIDGCFWIRARFAGYRFREFQAVCFCLLSVIWWMI